jgi:hypothetical protein
VTSREIVGVDAGREWPVVKSGASMKESKRGEGSNNGSLWWGAAVHFVAKRRDVVQLETRRPVCGRETDRTSP